MKMNRKITLFALLLAGSFVANANQMQTSNANPAYSQSNVQAQLRMEIKENTNVVHFIRDTNDPKIITKTYVLKNPVANSIRPYVREMVQAVRVNYNNSDARENTSYYNVYNKTINSTTTFVQTGVECVEFADGTNILIVSAEEYRFESNENGMGIDELIATLDQPNLVNSSGQPKYIYFPVNRSASELQTLIKAVGANVSNDLVELIGGKDKVEVDKELNCLFFNTAQYSKANIEEMLKLYDIVQPEVKISVTVYELDYENDGTLGLDFQSWKNNDGVNFFQTGANFSNNLPSFDSATGAFTGVANSVNEKFFNFQPTWNTKFLDFLVSKSKAKIISTGDLTVKNGETGSIDRSSGTLYARLTPITTTSKDISGTTGDVEHGNAVDVKAAEDVFKFALNLTPSINQKATTIQLDAKTINMLGYDSNGTLRTSTFDSNQKFMLSNGKNRLYLGGIDKVQTVSDVGGVPFLKDLPVIGWLFATERESTKKSQIVVVAECEVVMPNAPINADAMQQIELINKIRDDKNEWNKFGYRQYLLDNER